MTQTTDFNALVNHACLDPKRAALRPVIEKELLHYDILFTLSQRGFLRILTFQGGTALRLCHGAKRFSEDLDFAGGREFSTDDLMGIKNVLEQYIGERYGLAISVKEPTKPGKEKPSDYVTVDKWQLAITTRPAQKHLPKQRIRIEVANIPAYTHELLPIAQNYDFLPDGYSETFIKVESLDEILADKIIAYTARKQIKARDIWDLQWLLQKDCKLQIELVKKKIQDYYLNDFEKKLVQRMAQLNEAVTSQAFFAEMSRFLDRDLAENTLEKEGFLPYLTKNIHTLLQNVLDQLRGKAQVAPKFEL